MVSGAPDFTKKMMLVHAFDYEDKMPVYEVAPWAWDEDNDRLKVAIEAISADLELDATVQNWPADYPDASVLAKLGGGLPAALDSLALKVKEQSWPSTYNVSDRAARLLGVVYGSQAQKLQQKASSYELLVDPVDRAARLVGVVYGSQDKLQQRATSKELLVQIQHQGSEKDPTQIRALVNTDVVKVQGGQSQVLAQEAASPYELKVSLNQDNVGLPLTGQLPTVLDGTDLKVKEQSPITDYAKEATVINEYNKTMTSADTEYSQALPANTKALEFWCRDGTAIRFAFTTGKVATPTGVYYNLWEDATYYKESLNLSSKTLYVACASASKIVEIIAWS